MAEATTTSTTKKRPTFIWRWVRRGLVGMALLALLGVIFHRPLLQFALNNLVPPLAKQMGYDLQWRVDGSVTSDLELRDIRLTGPANSPLTSVTLHEGNFKYDLWQLWQQGADRFLHQLHLSDAEVELDLRRAVSASSTETLAPPAKRKVPEIRVDDIRLHNINVLLHQNQGDIVLKSLTLELIEGSKGQFAIGQLTLPDGRQFVDVKGTTELHGRELTFTDLTLLPNLVVQRLQADLANLPNGPIPFDLSIASGAAKIAATGSISGIDDEISATATIQIDQLSRSHLAQFVTLPESPDWIAEHLILKTKGPFLRPDLMQADLTLEASGSLPSPSIQGKVVTQIQIANGHLQVIALELVSAATTITATATAPLPKQWKEMAQIDAKVDWTLLNTDLKTLPIEGAPLGGQLNGGGSITLSDGKLTGLPAKLHGSNLSVKSVGIESIDIELTGSPQKIIARSIDVQLDPKNRVKLSGELSTTGTQPFKIHWEANASDLAKLASLAGINEPPLPEKGRLITSGNASGEVTDLKQKDYTELVADVRLDLDDVVWRGASLKTMRLIAAAENGQATLQDLTLNLDEQNYLSLSGAAPVTLAGSFTGRADVHFSEIEKLNPWLSIANAPPVTGGAVTVEWQGSGDLAQHSIIGRGALDLQGIKMAQLPDPVSAKLKVQHQGKRLELESITLSTGHLRLEGGATISETDAELLGLQFWSDQTKLASLSAKLPLALTAHPPIDAARPLDLDLQMENLSFDQIATALGRPLPIAGMATAKVKLHGPLSELSGEIAADLHNASAPATSEKLPPADVKFEAHLAAGILKADLNAHQPPFEPLKVATSLPFDLPVLLNDPSALTGTPLQAEIELPDSDLEIVRSFVPAIAEIDGKLGIKVQVGGTVAQPSYQGAITLKASRILATAPGAPELRDVNALLAVDGQKINIESFSAMVAGGKISANGSVDLTQIKDPGFDVHVMAEEALLVRDEALSQRANADLHLTGSLKKGDVTGHIDLVRGRVFKEVEFLPLSLPEQLPPPPRAAKKSRDGAKAPPPFDQWTFDIAVATKDQIRLLGNVLNGGVEIDLHARGTGAAPELEGKMSFKDTRLRLPFSRMIFSRGEILFSKDKPFEPQLDFEGDSVVNNYRVALFATGPALDPVVRFTSSPPLSEGDIATLLATGATAGDLASGEGVAANRAAFLLVTKMYRKLFNKKGKSQYDEEPPKLSFNFSLLNAGSTRRSLTAIYEINPKVQAVGTVSEDGGFRGLLYYLIRFR